MNSKDFNNMYCKPLKALLKLAKNIRNVELCKEGCQEEYYKDKKKIKEIFDIAYRDISKGEEIKDYILYFDGVAVDEPYDGLEFKSEEEEFYYNNAESKLVILIEDDAEFKISFKIKHLKQFNIDYNKVYTVVKYATEITKKSQMHPLKSAWLSSYKLIDY